MEWYTLDRDESIRIVLKPVGFPWIRISLKNYRTCFLKCDITPESTCSQFLKLGQSTQLDTAVTFYISQNFIPWYICAPAWSKTKETPTEWRVWKAGEKQNFENWEKKSSARMNVTQACGLTSLIQSFEEKGTNQGWSSPLDVRKTDICMEVHIAKGNADGTRKALYSLSMEV